MTSCPGARLPPLRFHAPVGVHVAWCPTAYDRAVLDDAEQVFRSRASALAVALSDSASLSGYRCDDARRYPSSAHVARHQVADSLHEIACASKPYIRAIASLHSPR